MNPTEKKMLARLMFQVKVHRAEGFEFENFFGQIMSYSRPGFVKVQPYGNQGDRGNDGYEAAFGRYYQVYAPQNPSVTKVAAIKKAQEDFQDKLIPYWSKICVPQEYIFVFNDKYKGTNIEIDGALASIKASHGLKGANVFLNKNLEDEFIALSEDQMMMIIGGVPDFNSGEFLDYGVLGEVIGHILNSPPEMDLGSKLISPDFEDKIKFNQLGLCGAWLRGKQVEVWQVDDYLSKNSDFAKQSLRDHLAGYYAESIALITSSQSGSSIGDLRFAYILDRMAPLSGNGAKDRLKKDAALVVMSKYFETCDIFEEPAYVNAC
ncbi:ABC-three component system protein [Pseudomonas sp. GD03944]|uniref:ABC-three component system protein n=1 Tax=Pseudomonas sp. GD03944 TaxID=2975409 RepID=UPI00244AF841|nr:ABC-three component system protein [Pseudomonas sp. GD03944]MDH1264666.1 hypothetical protein [Pseudomonas sp. GD03944]